MEKRTFKPRDGNLNDKIDLVTRFPFSSVFVISPKWGWTLLKLKLEESPAKGQVEWGAQAADQMIKKSKRFLMTVNERQRER